MSDNSGDDEIIYIVEAVYAIFLKWPVDNKLKIKDLVSFISTQDFQIHIMNPVNAQFIPVEVSVILSFITIVRFFLYFYIHYNLCK